MSPIRKCSYCKRAGHRRNRCPVSLLDRATALSVDLAVLDSDIRAAGATDLLRVSADQRLRLDALLIMLTEDVRRTAPPYTQVPAPQPFALPISTTLPPSLPTKG